MIIHTQSEKFSSHKSKLIYATGTNILKIFANTINRTIQSFHPFTYKSLCLCIVDNKELMILDTKNNKTYLLKMGNKKSKDKSEKPKGQAEKFKDKLETSSDTKEESCLDLACKPEESGGFTVANIGQKECILGLAGSLFILCDPQNPTRTYTAKTESIAISPPLLTIENGHYMIYYVNVLGQLEKYELIFDQGVQLKFKCQSNTPVTPHQMVLGRISAPIEYESYILYNVGNNLVICDPSLKVDIYKTVHADNLIIQNNTIFSINSRSVYATELSSDLEALHARVSNSMEIGTIDDDFHVAYMLCNKNKLFILTNNGNLSIYDTVTRSKVTELRLFVNDSIIIDTFVNDGIIVICTNHIIYLINGDTGKTHMLPASLAQGLQCMSFEKISNNQIILHYLTANQFKSVQVAISDSQ